MGHHHNHSHDNLKTASGNFLWALLINFAFVIIEIFYAYQANSMSLLSDAGHNLGDVLGLVMAWAATLLLARRATERYSYGFKRTTILAAIANAMLLIIATFIIVYESIEKILQMQTINETQVMIIAGIGILINGGTALLFLKGQDDLNTKAAFLHLASDALLSLGVVVTGAIILWTGWYLLDPIVGLIIAVMILYSSWGLMRDSVNLILDAVPHNIKQQDVANYLKQISGVKELHHLHIWGLSTREAALTAHLVMPQGMSDEQLHQVHYELAHQFHINHATIQVEKGDGIEGSCNKASIDC